MVPKANLIFVSMVASVIPQALVVAHDNPNVSTIPGGWTHRATTHPVTHEDLATWEKLCQMNSDLASMGRPGWVSKQLAEGIQYTFTFSNCPPVNVYEVPWLRDLVVEKLVVAHDDPKHSRATPEELGVWDKFCQMNSDLASMEKPVEVSKQQAPGFKYTYTYGNDDRVIVYVVPWLRDLVVKKLV